MRGRRSSRSCEHCRETFLAQMPGQRFCSVTCSSAALDRGGASNGNWRGGETTSPKGYVYLRLPGHPRAMKNGYVKRADVVAERMLGRPLADNEVVHHKNKVRSDDCPENLEVLDPIAHGRLHAPVRTKPPKVRKPRKVVVLPGAEELKRLVDASSLRIVAKQFGCSHVLVFKRLRVS